MNNLFKSHAEGQNAKYVINQRLCEQESHEGTEEQTGGGASNAGGGSVVSANVEAVSAIGPNQAASRAVVVAVVESIATSGADTSGAPQASVVALVVGHAGVVRGFENISTSAVLASSAGRADIAVDVGARDSGSVVGAVSADCANVVKAASAPSCHGVYGAAQAGVLNASTVV